MRTNASNIANTGKDIIRGRTYGSSPFRATQDRLGLFIVILGTYLILRLILQKFQLCRKRQFDKLHIFA